MLHYEVALQALSNSILQVYMLQYVAVPQAPYATLCGSITDPMLQYVVV